MGQLDQPRRSVAELQQELDVLRADYAKTALRLAEALNQNIRLRRELAVLLGSKSWRLTAPLRAASAYAGRAAHRAQALAHFRPLDAIVTLYRKAPLPREARLLLHKALLKVTPGAYASLRQATGAVIPPVIEVENTPARARTDILSNATFRAGFRRLARDIGAYAAERGGVTHVIVLPFFAIGGAQVTANNFARAIVNHGGGSVLIAADRTLTTGAVAPVDGALHIDLSDYFDKADGLAREDLLFAALRMIRPKTLHAINSEVAWRLLIREGERVRAFTRVFGAIFAFQFDWSTGEKVGYAATFLKPAIGQIDGLITDNQRFARDAIAEYDLEAERGKFHVVYNTVDLVSPETLAQGGAFATALAQRVRAAGRFSVLWAGRLDAEKRPDLLLAVARACPEMDFHVYGARVVDASLGVQFQGLSNVFLRGPYASAREVMAAREHHAMMFTSRWEGLANVLIEFGALGLPVVAATVGGVGELITEGTGYPVSERPSVDDYVRALRAIAGLPEQAAGRSERLLALIGERHSRASFAEAVARIPGYLS